MSKKGTLLYRCRRCHAIIKFATVTHLPASAKAFCITGTARDELGREQFAMRPHTCPDGQVGITDIIGGEYLDQSINNSSNSPTSPPPSRS